MNNNLSPLKSSSFRYFDKIKRAVVVYNEPDKNLSGDLKLTENDTLDEVNQVKKILQVSGIKTEIFGLTKNNIGLFLKIKTDFIFNLCYGIGSIPDSEEAVYPILDKLKIPYSGGPGQAVALTNNKSSAKISFQKNKIPTPLFFTLNSLADLQRVNLKYPLIVKPEDLGCSLGLDQSSVVRNISELKKRVKFMLKKYKTTILIEEYIEGREFSVLILGNGNNCEVFPLVEIVFGPIFEKRGKWKIFDFESKWIQNSEFCIQSPYVSPVKIGKKIENHIKEISLKAYKICGCRDYARIDLRVDKGNHPYILEINLNPSIGQGSQIETGLKAMGLTFGDLVKNIINISLTRFYSGKPKEVTPLRNVRL